MGLCWKGEVEYYRNLVGEWGLDFEGSDKSSSKWTQFPKLLTTPYIYIYIIFNTNGLLVVANLIASTTYYTTHKLAFSLLLVQLNHVYSTWKIFTSFIYHLFYFLPNQIPLPTHTTLQFCTPFCLAKGNNYEPNVEIRVVNIFEFDPTLLSMQKI